MATPSNTPNISSPQSSVDDDCSSYMRVAAMLGRSGDPATSSFFLKMGGVCQAYKNNEGTYSPDGQRVLQAIRPRLAKGLEKDAQSNPGKSGAELKKDWIANHPQVYKESGVCDLPMSDKAKIVTDASPVLRENPGMAVQAIVGAVGSRVNQAVGKDPLSSPYRAASTEKK